MGDKERELRQQISVLTTAYYNEKYGPVKPYRKGRRIPYAGRVFDAEEMDLLVQSALDFWLTAGHYAEEFEQGLRDFLDIAYVSLVNSGSSANLLALAALTSPKLGSRRIVPGDEVITIAASFPTTVSPILQYGAIPVFVDIAVPTYNVDITQLEAALSTKTRAVMLAHTMGNPFPIAAVKEFCEQHGLWLIEDNCDALGAQYYYENEWSYTGTFGDLNTSSFYPAHHITTGEGGAVYTNNKLLKTLVDSFRDWGRDCVCHPGQDDTCNKRFLQQFGELPEGYDHKYVYSHFGYNLKLTDMQAAIGCAQLKKLPGFIQKRRSNWEVLRRELADLQEYFILPEAEPHSQPSWFGFMLTVRENVGLSRDGLVAHLEEKGIQTRMLFAGNIIKQPCFDLLRKSGCGYRVIGSLSNTDFVMNRALIVGVYPGMNEDMLAYMISEIRKYVKGHG